MDVQKVCNEAADLIEEKGWCQGAYADGEGKHCLLGAIVAATAVPLSLMSFAASELWRWALISTLGTRLGWRRTSHDRALTSWNALTNWNDDPKRTKEEVVALLRDKLPVPVVVERG